MLLSREKFARMRDAIEMLPAGVLVCVADLKLIHEIAAFHIHRGCLAAGIRLPPCSHVMTKPTSAAGMKHPPLGEAVA